MLLFSYHTSNTAEHYHTTVMASRDELLYGHSSLALAWQNTLTCAVMLEKSHRFDDDPVYGPIMNRYRKGKADANDIKIINTRVIGASTGVEAPRYIGGVPPRHSYGL